MSTSLVGGTTITESSCLSSGGSNEISSSRKGRKKVGSLTKTTVTEKKRRRRGTGISHLSRKAEGIRKLLSSQGSFSEVRIRQLLGDSPDTSKALRMLVLLFYFYSVFFLGGGGDDLSFFQFILLNVLF